MAITGQGFDKINIRFFIWGSDEKPDHQTDGEFVETSEQEFLNAEGTIEYERHTVFANGCRQICLTKNPFTGC